jgi:hypothetical protein
VANETAGPPAAGQGERQSASLRYVDRPDVAETFVDSVTGSCSTVRHYASNRLGGVPIQRPAPALLFGFGKLAERLDLYFSASVLIHERKMRRRRLGSRTLVYVKDIKVSLCLYCRPACGLL